MMRGIIEDNRTQEYARKRAKERKQEEEKERDGERKRAELQKREKEWKQQSEQDELKRVEERKQKDAERATHNTKKADNSNGTEFHNDDSWESWRDAEVVTFTPSLTPPTPQTMQSDAQVRKGLEAYGIKVPGQAKGG